MHTYITAVICLVAQIACYILKAPLLPAVHGTEPELDLDKELRCELQQSKTDLKGIVLILRKRFIQKYGSG